MSAAQERRYVGMVKAHLDERAAEARQLEIVSMDIHGEYDHIKQAEEARRQLDGALLRWEAPRTEDYATKAEAIRVAKARGPAHFPLRAFTPFESFWVVVYITAEGWLSVGGSVLHYRPAADEETAKWGAGMNRTAAERPLYVVTKGATA